MIKKIFAYIISHILFWTGDFVSKVMVLTEWLARLYPLYNWLMIASSDVQEWAGNKTPWMNIEENTQES